MIDIEEKDPHKIRGHAVLAFSDSVIGEAAGSISPVPRK